MAVANQNKPAIRPPRLKPGDTVALWAPASPVGRAVINKGTAVLAGLGLRTMVPDAVFNRRGYLAGTDAQRAAAFQSLAADPAVKAIFCARGGYGSLRLLDLLDWEALAQTPKIIVGFSDVTALLAAVTRQCRCVVFHGPMAATVSNPDAGGLQQALMAPQALKLNGQLTLRKGKGAGPVIGGNLTTFCHLMGTAFEPKLDGAIWFIEEKGEKPYRIDRMLTQMRLAGRLAGLAGVVVGQLTDCTDPAAVHRLVVDACPDVPIAAGFNAGHGSPNLTLPIGLEAVLDAGKRTLHYRRAATANSG